MFSMGLMAQFRAMFWILGLSFFLCFSFANCGGSGGGASAPVDTDDEDPDSENSPEPMTAALRSSGVAPFAVFFDAVPEENGVVQPDEDHSKFSYRWNFGDDDSATWSTSGLSRNTAIGYVAAHVFENPGTYEVSLEVNDPANEESYSYVQTITVSDPETVYASSTIYISDSQGNDTTGDGSFANPWRTWSKGLQELFSTNGPRRLLLKRGDSFSFSTGSTVNNRTGPYTITSYGTGAAPIITSSGSDEVLSFGASTSDLRVFDIEFQGSGTDYGIRPGTQMLIYQCEFSGFNNAITTSDLFGSKEQNVIADNNIEGNLGYGIYYNFGMHVAILGNVIDKPTGGTHDHNARTYITHSLIGHNIFRGGSAGRHQLKFVGFFPTGNPDRSAGMQTEAVEYSIVSDNVFEESFNMSWVMAYGAVDDTKDQRIEHCIFERNQFRADIGTRVFIHGACHFITIRNNVFDATGSLENVRAIHITQDGIAPDPYEVSVLNNTFYRSGSFGLTGVEIGSMSTNTSVFNNLGSAASSGVMINGSGTGLSAGSNLWTAAAGFINSSGGNFHLQSSSPAIDAGAELDNVHEDLEWNSRPQGSACDLGAYEYLD